jgi:hypothetical protein
MYRGGAIESSVVRTSLSCEASHCVTPNSVYVSGINRGPAWGPELGLSHHAGVDSGYSDAYAFAWLRQRFDCGPNNTVAHFILVFDRRAIPVNWLRRGLTVPLLCVGIFGVPGCGADNESEGTQLAKSIGDPGKADAKGVPTTQEAPPANQQEFFERQKTRQKDMFEKGGGTTKK